MAGYIDGDMTMTMKNLKTYSQLFESNPTLTPEQIKWLDECTKKGGTWTLNPKTEEIDVDGNFDCSGQGLTDFKGVRFGTVGRNFRCGNNQLTSLEGAPKEVGGGFSCYDNQLTSLEGSPKKVGGGGFNCDGNQLTSLEGAPKKVGGGGFSCTNNQITSLEGAPQEVIGEFFCYHNPVANNILKKIFSNMKSGKSYMKTMESLWKRIPLEDQILLYRPEFEWVSPEEKRKLEALKAYQGFKGMI
jgi:hypothetical protein